MLFVYAAIVGTILFGISNIIIKFIVIEIKSSIQFLLYQILMGFFLLLPVYLLTEDWRTSSYYPLIMSQLSNIVLSGIFGILGFLFLVIGMETGNASVGTVIFSSRVMFVIPLAIVIVDEVYSTFIYVFIIVTFLGSIAVSWRKELRLIDIIMLRANGVKWFFATSICWAFSDLFVRQANNVVPVVSFLFIRQIIFLAGVVIFYIVGSIAFELPSLTTSRMAIFGSLSFVLTNLLAQGFFVFAVGESLTITNAIGTAQGVFTLIISLIVAYTYSNDILQEPLDPKSIYVRLIGAILAMVGTLGVVLIRI